MAPLKEKNFIGLRSIDSVAKGAALTTTCEYGLYHEMLLTYYAKHAPDVRPTAPSKSAAIELPLDLSAEVNGGEISVRVAWQGKPLPGAAITLIDSSDESLDAKADGQGRAAFKHVAKGLVGVTTNYVEDRKGEVNGKPFQSAYFCSTLTFNYGDRSAAKSPAADTASGGTNAWPALPEPLASFGGAVNDGWIYVYGGHIGEEHEHSKDNLSRHFRRLELVADAQWEELPMQTSLQGLPLVSWGDKVYRVGGLNARNAPGEKEDLHSVAEAAAFDPKANAWSKLPPLPEPRSSHDAVVIGSMLYVVGGWTLNGSSQGAWLDTAWSLDLADAEAAWKPVTPPTFRRRALALGAWQGQPVALGGMDENKKISRAVYVLDLKSGQWRPLADLPGEGMDGFGASACTVEGKLYVSGTQDSVYRLSDDGQSWSAVAKLTTPRFFHRLLPGRSGKLLLVGGAADDGHLADIEEVAPMRRPALEE
jgi:hypothetical protein